ncbi:unnamed protein product [Urochloa decumbens]|uniref:VQ domain-containing protein n=1 Tax=Urochloa decumbens TaxID=240449 RepID=A0ABC9E150_9POAL
MAAASFDAAGAGPLGVHAASRKIGKQQQERKPVIIYMVSPKVIHVEAHEFMPLVQRLTGPGAAGDKKGRAPATSGGGAGSSSSSPRQDQEGDRIKTRAAAPPVRVKARALNRPAGPAVSVSVTAAGAAPSSAAAAAVASPAGLMFHDLSPLRGAALKSEHHHHLPLVSPGWLHHVGDHFLSPGGGSPSAASFLDIFGPLSSQQQ